LSEQLLDLSALAAAEAELEREDECTMPPSSERWDWLFCSALVVGFALLAYANIHGALFQPLWMAAEAHRWGHLIVRPSILVLAMGAALLIFRTVFWLRYRPFPSASFATAPSLTVVIPAYNEGAMVMRSIESAVEAFYPRERLEVFVVDDGSTDDTWTYIRRAADRYPGRVTTVRLPKNQGKRAALEVGFRRARGEVIVTIDSDSVIDPDALLAVSGPFRDPRVGAVSGKVAVYNREGGIIPRMLHVQFVLSFDLMRAVESSYGTVYCCPGALTGYRASVVRQVMDDWMNQTFLGTQCTYGEDRALTNLVLAAGYNTVYQRSAQVRTTVPESYGQLCRMFLRWDRSYIREEIEFLRIVWKRPWRSRVIALCDRVITNLRHPVNYASLILIATLVADKPAIIFRVLAAIGVVALFNMIYYLRTERSKNFLYGICYSYFAFFGLSWILPYSALTLRSRSWLTR
jgi:hyaluronan synthase